jgi:predicted amidohydrolase YtcJ
MDPNHPKASIVAIRNGKILSVSGKNEIKKLSNPRTEVMDFSGKTIMPGFNDAHCHIFGFAESFRTLDLGPNRVNSIPDIQSRIHELALTLPPKIWIRGRGYNEFYLMEKQHPNRWDLDSATRDHPVKLTHRSGHAHVLNSLALTLTGISAESAEPPGGMIERDLETGELTGVLYGMSEYLSSVIPPLGKDEMEQGMKSANKQLISLGITSIQDASIHNNIRRWQELSTWKDKGCLKPRVNMMLGIKALREAKEQGLSSKTGDERLSLGAVKIILSQTRGHLDPTETELKQMVLAAHQAGFQVALHAVEESTISAALSALEYIQRVYPRSGRRHRIEHCSVCTPEMAKRLAEQQAVVVTQPAFIYYSGERYLKTVPPQELEHLYPIGTLIRSGLTIAASSDCPVVPPNPLIGIYAATSRTAETGQKLSPEQAISPSQSLWIYTSGGSHASHEEGIKGTITPGKLADIVVLSGDPTHAQVSEIKQMQVEMTIIDGQIVWQRNN